jgi:hypothetical protein
VTPLGGSNLGRDLLQLQPRSEFLNPWDAQTRPRTESGRFAGRSNKCTPQARTGVTASLLERACRNRAQAAATELQLGFRALRRRTLSTEQPHVRGEASPAADASRLARGCPGFRVGRTRAYLVWVDPICCGSRKCVDAILGEGRLYTYLRAVFDADSSRPVSAPV